MRSDLQSATAESVKAQQRAAANAKARRARKRDPGAIAATAKAIVDKVQAQPSLIRSQKIIASYVSEGILRKSCNPLSVIAQVRLCASVAALAEFDARRLSPVVITRLRAMAADLTELHVVATRLTAKGLNVAEDKLDGLELFARDDGLARDLSDVSARLFLLAGIGQGVARRIEKVRLPSTSGSIFSKYFVGNMRARWTNFGGGDVAKSKHRAPFVRLIGAVIDDYGLRSMLTKSKRGDDAWIMDIVR